MPSDNQCQLFCICLWDGLRVGIWGAGNTRTPTIVNLISYRLVEIPLAWTMAVLLGWGPVGVYWAIAFSDSIMAIMCIWIFRKGRWKSVSI